ncbi:MAG: DUF1015 domain-containing protein [Rubrivivax sp.]|nr:DUF1015 domain-containing protein [Rubrivivax sp.]
MSPHTAFRLPHICLPRPEIDLRRWAVVACDQYTAEPEYWARAEALVGEAPSTLRLIFPEAHLEAPDAPARVGRIQAAMRDYLARGLFDELHGAVLVERTVDGRTRRGLMLEIDLEHYDFSPTSTSRVRPTEGTIVARLAPRMAVRRDAPLELPHILVLIDDPGCTVIEPLATARDRLTPLYEAELMLGGGHVAGHAVDRPLAESALDALAALSRPEVFEPRHGVPPGTPPMLFAVGDGNHSLATAKAIWEQLKSDVGPDHPARWALVEVENIHDPALHFAPIHRLLFGVKPGLLRALQAAFGPQARMLPVGSAQALRDRVAATPAPRQAFGVIEPGGRYTVLELPEPPAPLAVASLQPVIDRLVAEGAAAQVDYVHGDDVIERLGQVAGSAGFHVPTLGKHELLTRVVQGGPLPRKTFSMGEAHEKRYYVECRRIA